MKNKTALVTGGTSGVGLSLVKELVKNNFTVFFIGTNTQKGHEIELELKQLYQTKSTFIELDLSHLKKVSEFANHFKNEVEQLDLLLNVAGVILPKRQETQEGIEKTFAIGYLSAYILSRELIPLLEKVKHSRIVNVSGTPSTVFGKKLNFDDLNFSQKYNGIMAAIATIHAKTVLTEILAEKLNDKNIAVNAFHPGAVKSNLTRNLPFILRSLVRVVSPFMPKTSKNGIYVSMSSEVEGISGQLFVNKKPIPLNFDKDYQQNLWQMTDKIIKTILP